jgi:hypothetical protein
LLVLLTADHWAVMMVVLKVELTVLQLVDKKEVVKAASLDDLMDLSSAAH